MYSGLDRLTAEALREGYRVLTEGYTRSDMALGRYLRSLDGGERIAKPSSGVSGEDQYMYVMLARKPRAVATILDALAGVTERIPTTEGLSQIERGLAEYAGRKTFNQWSFARYIGNLLSGIGDRGVFGKAAAEYSRGNCEAGYRILKGIPGFKLIEFIDYIRNASGQEREDRGNMSLNPDVRKSRVMNKWLFHGTTKKSAVQIALHGFDRGNKIGDLAYNDSEGSGNMRHDYTGDYLFAFDAEDLTDSKDDARLGKVYRTSRYGSTKIMFKASGYKIYHSGDEENQVIFDYHEPTGCFLIMSRDDAGEMSMPAKRTNRDEWLDDYQVVGRGKDGKARVLFSAENLKDCIRWVLKNGDTYAGMMFKWK